MSATTHKTFYSKFLRKFRIKIDYQPRTHYTILDSIRGLAIILVLLFHCFPYIKIFGIGWFGVDLFFVLSGFLITGILIDTIDHQHYWRNFAGRRVLRIFPIYYFSLLIFLVSNIFFPSLNDHNTINFNFFTTYQWWYWLYIPNWLVLFEGGWLPTVIFNHYWSLAIEEQFYLIWPVLLVLIYKWQPKYFIYVPLVFIVSSILLRFLFLHAEISEIAIYSFTFTRLDAIAFGSLAAIVVRYDQLVHFCEKYVVFVLLLVLMVFVAGLFSSASLSPLSHYFLTFGYTINALMFTCFLIIAVSGARHLIILKVFNNPVLRFFGKYSYAMYIFHWPVFRLFYEELVVLNNSRLLASAIVVGTTILLSLLSWHLLEKQFLKLKINFKYT